jgi:hypothetical protein
MNSKIDTVPWVSSALLLPSVWLHGVSNGVQAWRAPYDGSPSLCSCSLLLPRVLDGIVRSWSNLESPDQAGKLHADLHRQLTKPGRASLGDRLRTVISSSLVRNFHHAKHELGRMPCGVGDSTADAWSVLYGDMPPSIQELRDHVVGQMERCLSPVIESLSLVPGQSSRTMPLASGTPTPVV